MLREMAYGDAYGACFEFVKKPYPKGWVNDATHYRAHPELTTGHGRYTDDVQMSLAVAEEIIADGPWTRYSLAQRFIDVYRRDPRPGYGKGMLALLTTCDNGVELVARVNNNSTRSGGVMRAGVCGVFPTVEEAMDRARFQAAITHDSPETTTCSAAMALTVHHCLYEGGRDGLMKRLEDLLPAYPWSTPWKGWVSVEALPCTRAALTCLVEAQSLKDLLLRCVDLGGDVDTVAAMAMLAAGACGLTNDLDVELRSGLEQGLYGAPYLDYLDGRLYARATKSR